MRSSKRYSRTVTGLLLTILLGLEGTSLPAYAHPNPPKADQELYESGGNCQTRLLASTKKQKYRIYWERCIQPFDQLRSRYPKSPLVERSLFYLGELYAGLYRYSGDPKDLASSKTSYQSLIENYPKSQLAQQAQSRLDKSRSSTKPAGDPRVVVEKIRHWAYPDYTRLVLDLNRSVQYRQAQEKDPAALRLILADTKLGMQAQAQLSSLNTDLLRWVRFESSSPRMVQVIIHMEGLVGPPKVAPLSNPDRLVIDLFRKPSVTNSLPLNKNTPSPSQSTALAQPLPTIIQRIVIDPGHGGKDPGAIGRGGLMEKEVALDIGLRLRKLIEKRLGKTVIMTRKEDTFIGLDDRTLLANSKKADLFISIHANAHPRRSTRGVEIYLLGPSSNREALAVAARENSVSLESAGNLDRTLGQILFDLGRDYKINQSLEFAHTTRLSFGTILRQYDYDVVSLDVKRAPFYVLLNSNMPSILAEVSFISNPKEEQLLRKDRYRKAVTEALFEGLKRYIASLETTS